MLDHCGSEKRCAPVMRYDLAGMDFTSMDAKTEADASPASASAC